MINVQIMAYITTRCRFSLTGHLPVKIAWADYLKWCDETAAAPLSRNGFSAAFRDAIKGRGERENIKGPGGTTSVYTGVELLSIHPNVTPPAANEAAFLKAATTFKSGGRCAVDALYRAYAAWCTANAKPKLLKRAFLTEAKRFASGRCSYRTLRFGETTSKGFMGIELTGAPVTGDAPATVTYFAERCDFEPGGIATVKQTFIDYSAWCEETGRARLPRNAFSDGFHRVIKGRAERKAARTPDGTVLAYVGVVLKSEARDRPEATDQTTRFMAALTAVKPEARCSASQLYHAYAAWCRDGGGKALSKKSFLKDARRYVGGRATYCNIRFGETTSKGFMGLELSGEAPGIARCPTCNQIYGE